MICSTKDCGKVAHCKGMCSKCYYRVRRGGTPELSIKQQAALRRCEAPGCEMPHRAYGLCSTHRMQQYRKEHPETKKRALDYTKRWKAENPEKHASQQERYRKNHKEELSEYYKKWRDENRASFLAYQKSRKARVRKATPKWANLIAIRNFYFNCPKGWHVDHIIPLNGKRVSGFHVIDNLQYLPAIENLKKSNKL